ncbi:MAG: amino acid-binding protein [Methanomassiliicoccaceae archaeon]|nr:amino acid-binding protein [Methanomassiliicoccaceae archaeon]
MTDENIITQLSIFINNEPGRLAAIAGILKDFNINVKGFNLAESAEFGILRAIVDEPDRAYDNIRSKGVLVKKTDVIGIAIKDSPGSFFETADVLGKAGINIDYGYAYNSNDFDFLFIRVDDTEKAVKVLKDAKIKLIKKSEI